MQRTLQILRLPIYIATYLILYVIISNLFCFQFITRRQFVQNNYQFLLRYYIYKHLHLRYSKIFEIFVSTKYLFDLFKVSKVAKIRNRYNQVPHLTQDTYGKVTNSQLYTTNESQEVSPFPAGDHKA